jgi:hypothetical protein
MKYKITLLLMFLTCILTAQVTNDGTPASWGQDNMEPLTAIEMPSFDLEKLLQEDKANEGRKDIPWRFGHEFVVDYNLSNSGSWHTLADGSKIWRIRFYSEGAKSMNFLLSDFYMPKGATLYLYNNDRSDLLGAYDSSQNNTERVLGTWLVKGEDIWLEYYEPAEVAGQGKLEIFKLIHGYRTSDDYAKSTQNLNDSGDCNYDVDCVINDIQQMKEINKKAVAMIVTGGSGFCSGALINNTSENGVPYFLTANHCYSNPSFWAFRFNWISPNPVCASFLSSTNNPNYYQTTSGATLRARREATDFCLVEITSNLPSTWDLVWAGWDRSDNVPSSTFGIHHPSGDIMKVCRDYNPPTKQNGGGEYMWEVNDWDLGVTEGGSSGSPLFDNNGRIIGQLFAGSAACNGTSDNGGSDIYGRFGVSWDAGFGSTSRLKEWLDPNNTNAVTVDYYVRTSSVEEQTPLTDLFKVYPNPSAGIFNVSVTGSNTINYQMYNMLGQPVTSGTFSAGDNSLNISGAANGVYILQITDETGKTANLKLVKE